LPVGIGAIDYKFCQGDVPEIAAPLPLVPTFSGRVLRIPGSRIAPIDVFGQMLFMAERVHPNRDGHHVIAQLIADKIQDFPSFRDYVQGAPARVTAR
jgi:lysophospholipase L1-like esterase